MGAHNTATREYAERRAQYVIDALRKGGEPANAEADQLSATLRDGTPGGTLRDFMAKHEGGTLHTFQATLHLSGADVSTLSGLWAPGPREVDTLRASYVLLGGSRREFKGVTTLVTSERSYLGFASWGPDSIQLLHYYS